jgi:hypothetical protein
MFIDLGTDIKPVETTLYVLLLVTRLLVGGLRNSGSIPCRGKKLISFPDWFADPSSLSYRQVPGHEADNSPSSG